MKKLIVNCYHSEIAIVERTNTTIEETTIAAYSYRTLSISH